MIAFFLNNFNKESYKKYINNLEAYKIECSCGCKGSCIKYGMYKRKIRIGNKVLIIYIQRIYCKHCKTTHAILPVDIVPYKILSMKDTIEIIETYEANQEIDLDDEAKRVIKRYKIWKNKLATIGLSIKDELEKLISFCAYQFKMCFMQGVKKRYRHKSKIIEVVYKLI